jgi:predicted DCC family thiol-disulfide oxidoreductase YuxK
MKRLCVLYDEKCGLCYELKNWVARQPAFLELSFVPAGSPEAGRMFPGLVNPGRPEELIAISDEGGVYRDTHAYIMCLYALQEYREWAMRLSTPALMPLARQAFRFISRNRSRLSDWLGMDGEARLATRLKKEMPPVCDLRKTESETHCPFCKTAIPKEQAVYCPECGAIHHRECWIGNDYHCSIFGCSPEDKRAGVSG